MYYNMSQPNCRCLKCGRKWYSKLYQVAGILPKACPECHRYDWMFPRVRKSSKRKSK